MSQTKAYTRGVAARTTINNAVVGTGQSISRFVALFGDTAKGFVKGEPKPKLVKPKRKPATAKQKRQFAKANGV